MLESLSPFQVGNAKSTVEENGPDFFFLEYTIFLVPDKNLIGKAVVDILKDENNFIKGGAEGIIDFGVGLLKREDIVILCCEFCRELEEGLLEGFFRCVCIFLDEVKGLRGGLLVYFADG